MEMEKLDGEQIIIGANVDDDAETNPNMNDEKEYNDDETIVLIAAMEKLVSMATIQLQEKE